MAIARKSKADENGEQKTEKFPPGIRWRDSKTRKNGIRADRYYFIRYWLNGKDKEEGVGWASENVSLQDAYELLAIIKKNIKSGRGPQTLAEMRLEQQAQREAEQLTQAQNKKAGITFGHFFEHDYKPNAETSKSFGAFGAETALYTLWLAPVLADMPFAAITHTVLERIVQTMQKSGKKPATIKYAMAVVSQVWNRARGQRIILEDSPTKRVKLPKVDNLRQRFLTRQEAADLLAMLKTRSLDVHDITLAAIFCGARAGDLFKLKWGDIDFGSGVIHLLHTKPTKTRQVYMTAELKAMFKDRHEGQSRGELVFPSRKGEVIKRISETFDRAVDDLGLNEGVSDSRQKVVFHTTRHTFASWLVQDAVPLYTVQKLTGHAQARMVERYAHLAPDAVREAAMRLQGALSGVAAAESKGDMQNGRKSKRKVQVEPEDASQPEAQD